MDVCNYNHNEIVHNESECPLCKANERIEELEDKNQDLENKIENLEDQIRDLE